MNPLPIEGATRRMGAPQQWDHAKDGICRTLEILDRDGWMISAWLPSDNELKKIIAGQPIFLHVQGFTHPVVSLTVGGE